MCSCQQERQQDSVKASQNNLKKWSVFWKNTCKWKQRDYFSLKGLEPRWA